MPGPTVEVQVAVFAAAGGAYVTASTDATTSATTFKTDSSRIRHAPLRSPLARTRLRGAGHAPRRIDESDPGLTRLEEELGARGAPEGELVEDPVALPGAVHPKAVTEDGDRPAAGHPVVEALRAQRVLEHAGRPDVGRHDHHVLPADRAA